MKSASRLALMAMVFAFSAATVPATASANLLADFFENPDGALVGNNLWTAHSGAGAKAIQVAGGKVTLQQSAGSGEDVNHRFAQQPATAKTYAAFDLTVPAGTIGSANEYFAHFRPAGTDSNNFVARTYIGPPTAGGNFNLGIAAGSLTTTPLAPWASGLVFGQTYRVVIAYDGVTGTSTLWVDPANELSPSVSSTSAPLAGRLLASFALRQASPTGATLTEVIDELVISEQSSDFGRLASAVGVPSASQWTLVLLGGLMLVAGAAFVVRRRAIA